MVIFTRVCRLEMHVDSSRFPYVNTGFDMDFR